MRLKRCEIPDCDELVPMGQQFCSKPICPTCGSVHTSWIRGTCVGKPKMCSGCLAGNNKDRQKEYRVGYRIRPDDDPIFQPVKPKPRKQLSEAARKRLDAEQRRHDRALDERLYADCCSSPVRRLSREEIERVAHTVTPLERIVSVSDRAIYLWGTM